MTPQPASAATTPSPTQPRRDAPPQLDLGLPGFTYADLHDPVRLTALTAAFDAQVLADAPELHARYVAHRAGTSRLEGPAESELLVQLAGHVSKFLAKLFGVEQDLLTYKNTALRDQPLFAVKTEFVQRRVFKKGQPNRPTAEQYPALEMAARVIERAVELTDPRAQGVGHDEELLSALAISTLLAAEKALALRFDPHKPGPLDETAFAQWRSLAQVIEAAASQIAGATHAELRSHELSDVAAAIAALPAEATEADLRPIRALLDVLDRWLFSLTLHHDGHKRAHAWSLLKLPHNLDFQKLVPLTIRHAPAGHAELRGLPEHQRRRDGFDLTDPRKGAREVRSEIDYCILCHEREKDSCSSGFHQAPAKVDPANKAPLTGRRSDVTQPYKPNPLGIPLTGCPLEERISEAHKVGALGDPLGALAVVSIDNPMSPGTGHRICNDCMKACVYQRQEPVDIPQIETHMLSTVLKLRWGFEIWSLLTRWNPLKLGKGELQSPRPYSGVDAMVVGLGPAGYTLAHHLLNEGFGVIGVDGLKIEPLPPALLGRAAGQNGVPQPIEWLHEQFGAPLDERITSGFGGVSEYGITVRWDKRFLDILHLNLARRTHLRIYGGTRFG
ncbi:MAG: hypothetical protein JST92_18535, partial [Deltaproteobacteria bacterium]|nr:hypothetical protein [Deltaproteobacteria bacterium]